MRQENVLKGILSSMISRKLALFREQFQRNSPEEMLGTSLNTVIVSNGAADFQLRTH